MVTNPFVHAEAAERYARGRPFFHPVVMRIVRERLGLAAPVERALDVGCGTGLSSLALAEVAEHVVGIDVSPQMVAAAAGHARIGHAVASAESIPLRADAFDLVTVSQVIHWLDRARFLAEARRVMRPGGALAAYDNYLALDERQAVPGLGRWFTDSYLARYPSPPRAPVPWRDADAWRAAGFHLLHCQWYENEVAFSPTELVDYLVTQSNVIAAVEGGREDIGSVRRWLLEGTASFFGGASSASFTFGGPLAILQPIM